MPEGAADQGDALLHPEETQAEAALVAGRARSPGRSRGRRREPRGVTSSGAAIQVDPDVAGAGVLGDVGQRFLGDPVEDQLDLGRQPAARPALPGSRPGYRADRRSAGPGRPGPRRSPRSSRAGGRSSIAIRRTPSIASTVISSSVGGGVAHLGVRRGFERGQAEELGEEDLGGVVVQLAGDPLALLLLGADHLGGQGAELVAVAGDLVQGGVERGGELGELGIDEGGRGDPDREVAGADGGRPPDRGC